MRAPVKRWLSFKFYFTLIFYGEVIGKKRGANYNRYEVLPACGVRISSIVELKDDIALRLAAPIRFIGLLPGEAAVFIDVAHYSNNQHTDDSNSVVTTQPQEDAIKILNEAERSFNYTMLMVSIFAKKRCGKCLHLCVAAGQEVFLCERRIKHEQF